MLALTRYSRLGASSRLRCLQFLEPLAARAIEIVHRPLFGDAYLAAFYDGRPRGAFGNVVWPMLRRLGTMLSARSYDVVWLEKEAFPFVPWVFEYVAGLGLPPIVVDYDDAIFHNYDLHNSYLLRALLGRKIDRVMASAHTVIVGNAYLADRARVAGATNIVTIPTVLDPSRYHPEPRPVAGRFRIGWIGTKSTAHYLNSVVGALAKAQRELEAEIVVIGVGELNLPGVNPTYLPWTEESEAKLLSGLSVGIMPLTDNPWDRGKCGYKILQYMASGIPAIASPVGANKEIISDGVTGFLVTSEDEWFAALKRLHSGPRLALSMGRAGRQKVELQYSVQAVLPCLESSLRGALVSTNP